MVILWESSLPVSRLYFCIVTLSHGLLKETLKSHFNTQKVCYTGVTIRNCPGNYMQPLLECMYIYRKSLKEQQSILFNQFNTGHFQAPFCPGQFSDFSTITLWMATTIFIIFWDRLRQLSFGSIFIHHCEALPSQELLEYLGSLSITDPWAEHHSCWHQQKYLGQVVCWLSHKEHYAHKIKDYVVLRSKLSRAGKEYR